MNIHPVGTESFHADRQTDGWAETCMTKLRVALRNSAKAPKNVIGMSLLVGLHNHWCSTSEYIQMIYFFKNNGQCETVSNA